MADVDWYARGLATLGTITGLGGLGVSLKLLSRDGYRVQVDLSNKPETRQFEIRVRNNGGVDVEVDRIEISEGGGAWRGISLAGPTLPHPVLARRSIAWTGDIETLRRTAGTNELDFLDARSRIHLSTGRSVTTRSSVVGRIG
ncbi:hypothetical protein [Nocardioides aurantiacus]|uniref:hypothetical protein n=1 Tax=Nocardioides aurantiacus TaxID=86796 RepID=UPI0011CE640F|nr:hypothetical protein [Nocardioides aurantiacus]